jgi:hypothetical protein
MSVFMKIGLMETELIHANRQTDRQMDEQTDMTKLIVAFHGFGIVPKKSVNEVNGRPCTGMASC